jgi:3-oxoacyl-[acyl-carrier-protein] synthase III
LNKNCPESPFEAVYWVNIDRNRKNVNNKIMINSSRNGIISGLGRALPSRHISNDELSRWVDTSDEWIRSHTGIESRYLVGEGETCSSLGISAARKAVEQAGISPSEIGMVICATSTPDYKAFPSTAALIQDALGLDRAGAFDLEAACSGFSYALEIGRTLIQAGTTDHVLIIGSEVLSSVVNWKDRNTCVLFGDGAGAAVLSVTEEARGIQFSHLRSDGSGADALIIKKGGSASPVTAEWLAATDNPGAMFIQMEGRKVYDFAVRVLVETIDLLLEKAGIPKEELDHIVPHQANIRIIQAAAKRSNIPLEKFFVNLQEYGNTSAATIPIAFKDMEKQNLLKKGQKIITVGFGAGLTYGGNYIIW